MSVIQSITLYIIVAELGDYDNLESQDYISKLKMLPKQSLIIEEKVAEYHKSLTYVQLWCLLSALSSILFFWTVEGHAYL